MAKIARFVVPAAVWLLAALTAGPAGAHALLLQATPAPNAAVQGSSVDISLHYNSRIDPLRSRMALKGPEGQRSIEVHPGAGAADLAAHLEGLTPGKHVLHWDVLSVDGHVSRGDLPFTVIAP
jgi:methionine-rich copper-binding protein CopC